MMLTQQLTANIRQALLQAQTMHWLSPLGTGVGGGIIINGKVYSGSNFAGGELGHTVIVVDGRPLHLRQTRLLGRPMLPQRVSSKPQKST